MASFKVAVIIVRFPWNLNFRNRFSKNAQKPNFMEIRSVGAVFRAERLTDGTDRYDEANSRFS
jgi:hypothetical protein